jgi:hypothetical protein
MWRLRKTGFAGRERPFQTIGWKENRPIQHEHEANWEIPAWITDSAFDWMDEQRKIAYAGVFQRIRTSQPAIMKNKNICACLGIFSLFAMTALAGVEGKNPIPIVAAPGPFDRGVWELEGGAGEFGSFASSSAKWETINTNSKTSGWDGCTTARGTTDGCAETMSFCWRRLAAR